MSSSSLNIVPLVMRDLGVMKSSIPASVMPLRSRSRRPDKHQQPLPTSLAAFYSRAGLPLPRLEKLSAQEIPRPYRKLLVHSVDLTPTLETFYSQTLSLAVLNRWREDDSYMREVVLRLVESGKKVGYGAIRILLGHLPPPCVARVLEEQAPFGNILQTEGIPHISWPQAFFSAQPDVHMRRVLGMHQACRLYGRRNVLLDGSRRLLAEVVEFLAPVTWNYHEKSSRAILQSPGRNGASATEDS